MAEIGEAPARKSRKGLKIGCGVFALLFVGAAIFFGPTLWDFYKRGFFDAAPEKHAYSATSEQNLKVIYQALSLYHESEGQFPHSDGWMDAIENRLHTNDLEKNEAKKKLVRPDLLSQEGKYGYAMNDAASAKYKDDIKDPSQTPLIYESKETGRNEHGNPVKTRSGLAISVDGTVLKQD